MSEAAAGKKQPEDTLAEQKKWLQEMRGYLMAAAALVTLATFRVGLNPPGGFWPDTRDGHSAGDPVLRDKHWVRYALFYYCNATAFLTSVAILVLLATERFDHRHGKAKVMALMFTAFVALASFVGTYIAGTTCWPVKLWSVDGQMPS